MLLGILSFHCQTLIRKSFSPNPNFLPCTNDVANKLKGNTCLARGMAKNWSKELLDYQT